jgi:hypothetical protein
MHWLQSDAHNAPKEHLRCAFLEREAEYMAFSENWKHKKKKPSDFSAEEKETDLGVAWRVRIYS